MGHWIRKRHPMPRLNGRAMEYLLLVLFREKLLRDIEKCTAQSNLVITLHITWIYCSLWQGACAKFHDYVFKNSYFNIGSLQSHYSDMASEIIGNSIVCSAAFSGEQTNKPSKLRFTGPGWWGSICDHLILIKKCHLCGKTCPCHGVTMNLKKCVYS